MLNLLHVYVKADTKKIQPPIGEYPINEPVMHNIFGIKLEQTKKCNHLILKYYTQVPIMF